MCDSVDMLSEQGYKAAVLAQETSLEELTDILAGLEQLTKTCTHPLRGPEDPRRPADATVTSTTLLESIETRCRREAARTIPASPFINFQMKKMLSPFTNGASGRAGRQPIDEAEGAIPKAVADV